MQPWTRLAVAAVRVRADVLFALFDTVLIIAAYAALTVVRFHGGIPQRYRPGLFAFVIVAVAVHLGSNWAWGLYGQLWRYASVQEARRVLMAGAASGVVLFAFVMSDGHPVPMSVVALGCALATSLIGAARFQSRLFAFRRQSARSAVTRVGVVGAGEAGAAILSDMLSRPDAGYLPVAVLDDDQRKQGRQLMAVPVAGGLDDLVDSVALYDIDLILVAIPSADRHVIARIAEGAERAGVPLKVVPTVAELMGGEVTMRSIRDVRIEDLLGREQVKTDLDAVRAVIEGRRVLVTGAGGSIGSEIVRQVAALQPEALCLLDHDETHLYEASFDLSGPHTDVLADIRDGEHLLQLFLRYRPDVVFHAAAHKHVPLLEAHPCEAAATNVLGTANVVEAATLAGVERLVFISTDKAVCPSSVMGASKRLGELVALTRAPTGSKYCAVRFGNVFGSRGSVIPTFMRQIAAGGPVTVTDPRMSRFFMSIEEGVELVLQAAAFAHGGEIFMLEMGEPIRIIDLAKRMVRLSGHAVGSGIEIRITGMRPGEKLAEQLRLDEEVARRTDHPAILRLSSTLPPRQCVDRLLERLAMATTDRDDDSASATLFEAATGDRTLVLADAASMRVGSDHPKQGEQQWNLSTT